MRRRKDIFMCILHNLIRRVGLYVRGPARAGLIAAWMAAAMLCATVAHAAPTPYDYWSFDKPGNRLALTGGAGGGSMIVNGSSYTYVTGANGGSDSAIQLSGTVSGQPDGTYLICKHNIAANGGGSQVNVYTMMWDMKYTGNGTWKDLLQTATGPSNDGDLFINTSGQVGSSTTLGGYGGSTTVNSWYRIVLVINTSSGTGDYDGKVFVNGSLAKQIYNLNLDSTLCLYAGATGQFEIHCDDNGEDDTMVLSSFAIWNSELSNSDVATLGGPGTPIMLNNQTITFSSPGTQTYGVSPISLNGSSDSGLAVSYSVVSGPATVSGNALTITGAGTVTVRASQAGDGNFNAAANADQTFTVNKASQAVAVAWSAIPAQTYGGSVNLASYVSGGSGTGGWVFGVVSGPSTLNGSTATFNGVGAVVFSAYKASDANYNQSGTVNSASVTVNKASQVAVTWTTIPAQANGGSVNLSSYASGGSGTGGLVFGVVSGSATLNGSTATFNASGTAVFSAYRAADGNYNDSAAVNSAGVSVGRATPSVTTWPAPGAITYGQALSASTLSGGVASVAGTFAYTAPTTVPTSVGTFSASVTFTPTDTNYDSISGLANVPINKKALTITGITANNKVYDGGTNATLTGAPGTLSGVVGSDVVSLTGTAVGAFADKNVGTSKNVSVSGLSLTGAAAGNYTLPLPTLTANITIATVTVASGLTADNRVYDKTTVITISSNSVSLSGVAVGDAGSVILSTNGYSASVATASAGNNKTVTVGGLTLTGSASANYTLPQPALSVNISQRLLAVAAVASNKSYDGTTTATVTLSDNRISGDALTVAYTTAVFADKNVGGGKTVTVSGISISGTDAANYSVNTTGATTANITGRALTISAAGINKTYDGTISASVTLLDNRIASDAITTAYTSATFVSKNVGADKTVSVSGISIGGTDVANYVANASASTVADITARAITVTAQSNTKLYDGATSAAALPMITTGDLASGDTAAWTESYDTKDVGVGKTLVPAGSVSDDNDGKNYAITFVSDSTGVITPVSLTVAGLSALNRVYDGTPVAAITGAPVLSGVVVGDTVTLTGVASGVFADAQLGAHKQVTVTGLALGGSDSGNYTLTLPTLFADITGLPPVAGDYEMGTWRDQTNNISTRKLLRVCSDPGHYSLSITAAGPSSARGGALRLVGEIITYTPVSGFVGIDTFQYTVANTLGLTAQGTVTVVVRPSDRQGPSVIGSPEIKDGAVIVRFAGIPGIEYNVEATEDLNNWATIGSATAGANGLFQYVDTDAAEHPSRFYRCRKP